MWPKTLSRTVDDVTQHADDLTNRLTDEAGFLGDRIDQHTAALRALGEQAEALDRRAAEALDLAVIALLSLAGIALAWVVFRE